MLFTPKFSKYKKHQKNILFNKIKSNVSLSKWCTKSLKLISLECGSISAAQLIAVRFLIKKFIKKVGLLRFNVFPTRAVSKKPSEIRMGKGKGNFSYWSCDLKSGVVFCEVTCKIKHFRRLLKLFKRVQIRIPIKTKIKY